MQSAERSRFKVDQLSPQHDGRPAAPPHLHSEEAADVPDLTG
jgi:hypothetical protein